MRLPYKSILAVWIGVICLVLLSTIAHAAPLVLAESGKSAYSIYCDAQAPKSVKRAALELQTYLLKSTGIKLPVTNTPASPMICLGVNQPSRAAGFDKDLPDVGFRIVTHGNDVFILGNDTADGKEQWNGDVRQGTLLGACDFLERVANIRWLLPGDVGEDVPKSEKLVVPDLDVRETPTIRNRWLIGVRDRRPDVNVWKTHNKVDIKLPGTGLNWSHSFNSTPSNDVLRAHPEFMAMKKDGTRAPVPPVGAQHVMYCLSNPQFIEAFAESINMAFDQNPKLYSMSMSPDEGADFCECPDCKKVAMAIPQQWKDLGAQDPQRTPVVMHFYNEVAKRVREKHPDRMLGGFIYQAYLVPLEKPIAMESNIVLGIAVNTNYGYKLYQPKRMAIMQQFFDEWGKCGVQLGYYSYDTWMRNWFGFPLPPGKALMKWNFPMYKKNHVQYLQYFGQDGWGCGGVSNYMAAKLMWNADADVDALYNEYLARAYGPDVAPLVDRMYNLVDDRLQAYIQSKPAPDHEIDYVAAKAIFAPIYPEIEKLYLDALTKNMTDVQRQRLEMIGDNLVLTNFHLRKAKLLSAEDAKKSPLFRSTDDVEDFVTEKEKTLSIIPVSEWVKMYRYTDMPVLREGWRPK